jgi:hypothetical protein
MSSENTISSDKVTRPPGLTIMGLAEAWVMTVCAAESVLSTAAKSKVAEAANFILKGGVVCLRCAYVWRGREKEWA